MEKNTKVWFVTGASKGLGLTLVKKLLADGYKVAATSRNTNSLVKEAGPKSANFLPLQVELVHEDSVKKSIDDAIGHFGKIDIVVNNAGYGQFGTLEELTDEESRKNFDVNVFGLLNVIRNVMPFFRRQKSGHFFNITSIGGYVGGYSGWGIYCATKFAVSGLTEALEADAKAFGIKTTLVYPGYFRTDFLSSGSMQVPAKTIADYADARQSESLHRDSINGNQAGDPDKLAACLIKMSNEEKPPLHLFLGQDAYDLAIQKMKAVKDELEHWKEASIATAYDLN